jgi:hypothetical protein
MVDLPGEGRATVWVGELPHIAYEPTRVVAWSTSGRRVAMYAEAAIELFKPLGGRFLYGLLGGRLRPLANGELKITVGVSTAATQRYQSSLFSALDRLWCGLPAEFALGAEEGIRSVLEYQGVDRLPAAELVVDHAAYGEIGSSRAVFKQLAVGLVELLLSQPSHAREPSDAEVAAFLRRQP